MSKLDEEIIQRAEKERDLFLNSRKLKNYSEEFGVDEINTKVEDPRPLDKAVYHGITGEFMRLVCPDSEADPAAILFSFLTAVGNLFGNSPRFVVESTSHPMRLFIAVVGKSSRSRKGTSFGYIERLFSIVDPNWKIKSGLSSGEGVIYAVRDKVTKINKKNEEEVIDEGVKDKRLLVIEEEFASVLKIVTREGNILSPQLRRAWDKDSLQILTKNNPYEAHNAHISVIGHITIEELLRCLNSTEISNGFGNRFLWVYAKRSKSLPNGGRIDEAQFQSIANKLRLIKDSVQGLRKDTWMTDEIKNVTSDPSFSGWNTDYQVKWSSDAQLLWNKIYSDLSPDDEVGIVGALLGRAEAYVCRLSSIYALLDKSFVISVNHLRAAIAVWDYANASVKYVFQGKTGDPLANKILDALVRTPEGLTKSDINNYFKRNLDSEQLTIALETLIKLGKVKSEEIQTDGRPAVHYSLNSFNSSYHNKKTFLEILDDYIIELKLGSGNNYSENEINDINELIEGVVIDVNAE